MVQQLAYLGVKRYTVMDHDLIEDTNLNRLVGASVKDLDPPVSKIANSTRMIRSIRHEEDRSIKSIAQRFPSEECIKALEEVDIIFGCVDSDGPRLILTEFSSAYEKPYFDLATEVHPQYKTFGGRIFCSIPGRSCLHCRGELSIEEIRRDLQSDAEAREDETIYGVDRSALNGSGPSVVSINGIIASYAVNEFMVYVTGIQEPKELLVYDGSLSIVKNNRDARSNNCYYCTFVKGMKGQANIERYIPAKKEIDTLPK